MVDVGGNSVMVEGVWNFVGKLCVVGGGFGVFCCWCLYCLVVLDFGVSYLGCVGWYCFVGSVGGVLGGYVYWFEFGVGWRGFWVVCGDVVEFGDVLWRGWVGVNEKGFGVDWVFGDFVDWFCVWFDYYWCGIGDY